MTRTDTDTPAAERVKSYELARKIKKGKAPELKWHDATGQDPPPMNHRVYVRGSYTPDGMGWPIAYRRSTAGPHSTFAHPEAWRWESNEWRGMVAISHWAEIPHMKKVRADFATAMATAQPEDGTAVA